MKAKEDSLRMSYVQRPSPECAGFRNIQAYFPSLETMFPSIQSHTTGNPTLAASELLVDISGSLATVENLSTKKTRQVPVWTRSVHLLEPVDVMSGDYILPKDGALPTFKSSWQKTLRKINDPYNEAYTAAVASCMTSRLVETGVTPHFCRFYGTYSGRAADYRYNITEDLRDIEEEKWFREGISTGKFTIMAVDPYNPTVEGPFEPWMPPPIRRIEAVSDDEQGPESISDEDQDSDKASSDESSIDVSSEEGSVEIPLDAGEVTVQRQRIQIGPSATSHSSGSSSYDTEDDLDYMAILKDFPVQLTFLEKCDGTMDNLMDDEVSDDATDDMKETKEARWTAWMFQVIAALTVVQDKYDLIHNDLHTNNITWSGTAETHLYYHVGGAAGGDRYYKVPTYGRIFKIIDFGRATFREPGGRTWFPDVYGPEADAEGQYNCGPFFDQSKPKVVPNPSFDLCRLAVAMLESIWPEKPAIKEPKKQMTSEPGFTQYETVSPLWNLLWLWLTDKEGRNFLRLPNGRERYPEFDLYCAIAKSSNNAVPSQQLTLPLFDEAYKIRQKDVPGDVTTWKLHVSSSNPKPAKKRAVKARLHQ